MSEKKKIAVIGGGLSGVLVAMNLAEKQKNCEVILIEKDPEKLGRGVAYQQEFTHQPLNVVASGMSLYPEDPEDFVNWLHLNSFRYKHLVPEVHANAFIPRKIFGDYVVERLKYAHDKAGDHFQIRIEEVVSIAEEGEAHLVTFASGYQMKADHVVLALGNFPPSDVLPGSIENTRYFSNPWTDKIYQNIKGNEEILLIGTGLTAVDVVLGLQVRNFSGKITMLSRRGRLPLPHYLSAEKYTWKGPFKESPSGMFKAVTETIKNNPEVAWPLIVDSLRPYAQKIWQQWTIEERQIFLKRFRPFWEIVRHRIPQASSEVLEQLINKGMLRVLKGNVTRMEDKKEGLETTFVNGKTNETNVYHKIINCTGPESNYRKVRFPIIRDLMEKGKVVPDALGLGIICDGDGNLLDKNNQPVKGLWCVGPMRKAVLWETTALKEIREQAAAFGKKIV